MLNLYKKVSLITVFSLLLQVNHFSKYGLQDDNDEFSPEDLLKAQQLKQQQQQLSSAKPPTTQMTAEKAPKTSQDSLLMKSNQPTKGNLIKTPAMETALGPPLSSPGLGGAFGPPTSALVSPPSTSQHLLPSSSLAAVSSDLDQVC